MPECGWVSLRCPKDWFQEKPRAELVFEWADSLVPGPGEAEDLGPWEAYPLVSLTGTNPNVSSFPASGGHRHSRLGSGIGSGLDLFGSVPGRRGLGQSLWLQHSLGCQAAGILAALPLTHWHL